MLATDGYGRTSVGSPWRTLIVDTIAPTFTRNPIAQPVAGTGMEISGGISDNYNLGALQACLSSTCVNADLKPLVPFTPTVVLDKPAPITISGVACPGGSGIERSFTVGSNFAVGSVQLELAIAHARRGELTATLIGSDNTQVKLLADDSMGGGDFANYNVALDDHAAVGPADALANDLVGSGESSRGRRPFEPLQAFYGKPSAGVWRVRICDTAPSVNQGQYLRGALMVQPIAEIHNQATWAARLSLPQGQDSVAHTLVLKANDAVGNRSQAVSQRLLIDNVAPRMTVRQVATTSTIGAPPKIVLDGTMSDGGTIGKVLIMVRTPAGETYSEKATISGGSWIYALKPTLAGDHTLMVVVIDAAGNVSSSGEYTVKALAGEPSSYRTSCR